jgi:hypothetical protein
MSVLPTTTISLLERSKLARQNYKGIVTLINKLEALNEEICVAQIKLEAHINSVEIINTQEIKAQIEERTNYLEKLNSEISKYDTLPPAPSSDATSDGDRSGDEAPLRGDEAPLRGDEAINNNIETLENLFSIPCEEGESDNNKSMRLYNPATFKAEFGVETQGTIKISAKDFKSIIDKLRESNWTAYDVFSVIAYNLRTKDKETLEGIIEEEELERYNSAYAEGAYKEGVTITLPNDEELPF